MKQWLTDQLEESSSLQAVLSVYRGLSQPRQRGVLFALFVIVTWAVIKLTFVPFYNDYQEARDMFNTAKSDYMLLAKHASDISSIKNVKADEIDRSSAELRRIVNITIKAAKLPPEVISREGNGLLRIGISNAQFAKIAQWLDALARQKVKIKSMQIQVLSPGMVSFSITLD